MSRVLGIVLTLLLVVAGLFGCTGRSSTNTSHLPEEAEAYIGSDLFAEETEPDSGSDFFFAPEAEPDYGSDFFAPETEPDYGDEFALDTDDNFMIGENGELVYVGSLDASESSCVFFGNGYGIEVPSGYEFDYADNTLTIIEGYNEITGGEFSIVEEALPSPDFTLESLVSALQDTMEEVTFYEHAAIPRLTVYSPEEDIDSCFFVDASGETLYIIGFSRVDGVNVGQACFETLTELLDY